LCYITHVVLTAATCFAFDRNRFSKNSCRSLTTSAGTASSAARVSLYEHQHAYKRHDRVTECRPHHELTESSRRTTSSGAIQARLPCTIHRFAALNRSNHGRVHLTIPLVLADAATCAVLAALAFSAAILSTPFRVDMGALKGTRSRTISDASTHTHTHTHTRSRETNASPPPPKCTSVHSCTPQETTQRHALVHTSDTAGSTSGG
jgi:hypothetical protein